MPDAPTVCAERFSYRYPGAGRLALDDISLAISAGTFTVIAGSSGSGKSTLLRALTGLVPHFHGGEVSGELEVARLDLRRAGPGEIARVCGTVFQDPESQIVMSGVRAELSLPLEQRGVSAAAVARAVEEAALVLGIADLLERAVETLSGGELQRVALAAALAHRPALLVLDEPTSQLDPVAGAELVWLLRRLNEEWGTTVVLAEHRLERCLPAADRVVALRRGRLACEASPADFLAWAAADAPGLLTPAARLFSLAGMTPPPRSVKEARSRVEAVGAEVRSEPASRSKGRALRVRGVWHELRDGPALLRGIDLRVDPGERIALMGRNGAGKSTLLRHAKGLLKPTRGRLDVGGDVALLLQNPGDYLIHERIADEAGEEALLRAGLGGRGGEHPRDLSGGERQRLALEIVLAGQVPALVLLDEPTRGMDRGAEDALVARLEALAGEGAAAIVATHDAEFAARFADRVVLLGKGVVIADGPPEEVLGGGWHFATDTARVLDGAALTPEAGAALLVTGSRVESVEEAVR